ncbi:hypothetical protein TOPH_06275 [Tolypocladium ophioglossoides CBS 100239]|uniref:Uncharacterized protein n=1 Tax=Tolypocladium ophioglossoides (strain CBS 100239) TaxID=1163406 RepID=A0A0L0N4F8_TOLOC|nr:hypothetical protein TOPH_06275 [Tolypocladium ophioglossoides CBS 100239]
MSWARDEDYEAFNRAAHHYDASSSRQWSLRVWDVTEENPEGGWYWETSPSCLRSKAELRIVFSPLHAPREHSLPSFLELFRILRIPSDFTTERIQSVCHSFSRRTDEDGGCCSWFSFLYKNISVKQGHGQLPEVDQRVPSFGYGASTLPQADYSWLVSSFFLRVHDQGGVVLVCFGAPPEVRRVIEKFVDNRKWNDVKKHPYVLFDLVLEGLYTVVDEMVWNMNSIFGPLEHSILELAHTKDYGQLSSKISFAALHNCAKHIIYLAEGLEACMLLVDAALMNSESVLPDPANHSSVQAHARVKEQLKECLRYRRSLFRSTQLRLASLQKRIDNTITLAFNVVTQKDSMVVTRDSSVMKMIAAITMIFLPTTGVAAVAGSQLLVANWHEDQGSWSVMATPLFWLTWWIAIPVTVCVVALAFLWQWLAHSEQPHREARRLLGKPAAFVKNLRRGK